MTRVSLSGKTVMPMLIDLHVHVGFLKDGVFAGEHYTRENIVDQLNRAEFYGVGAVLSLGTDLGIEARQVREDQRAGKLGGATLFIAGRGFVAPGGAPTVSPLEHVPFEVDRQDLGNMEWVQKGLRATRKPGVTLARYQESQIRHFHRTLDGYLSGENGRR